MMKIVMEASYQQQQLFTLYGLFMISWSIAENVVQTAIWKQLGVDVERGAIVTAKLQFNPKVGLLRSLLKIHGDEFNEAMTILVKLEGFAQRNTLVHGQVIVGDPNCLTFIKSEGGNVLVKKFKVEQMQEHIYALNERTNRLQALLGVTHEEMQLFCNHLVEKAGGIPS